MQYRMAGCFLVVGLSLSVIAGCGGEKGVTTVDVSGTVYLDDKPVANVSVNFLGPEYAGIAKTGADGKYQLKAQPGENKLYFTKYAGVAEGDEGMAAAVEATSAPGAVAKSTAAQEIPSKYTNVATSEMTYSVPEAGATNADFKLTSK